MMKNSEWGAVAYLSHSEYGINGEIRINNYYNNSANNNHYLTGCGAASATTISSVSKCSIPYGSGVLEYPQSTTGNISGIFDMSGGASEYVMGNYGNKPHFISIPTLPESKYYDLYPSEQFTGDSSTNIGLCTLENCGGHALNETKGWYFDNADFVNNKGSLWFVRGGDAVYGQRAGAFYFGSSSAQKYYAVSWRSVLVGGDGA